MIAKLRGKVDLIRSGYVVVETAGIGYKIFMNEIALAKISSQKEVELFIYTYVREDQFNLFGFLTLEELEIFELLLSISGIGPKAGLGILNIASPQTIKTAIVSGNSSILTRVSGIGKKTAERIILELKNKVGEVAKGKRGAIREEQEVLDALMAMGYSISEAREAIKAIPKEAKNISEKIRWALKAAKK